VSQIKTPVLMCNTDRLRLRSTECMRWRQRGDCSKPRALAGLTKSSLRLGGRQKQTGGREEKSEKGWQNAKKAKVKPDYRCGTRTSPAVGPSAVHTDLLQGGNKSPKARISAPSGDSAGKGESFILG
jgi:hypothetical protein